MTGSELESAGRVNLYAFSDLAVSSGLTGRQLGIRRRLPHLHRGHHRKMPLRPEIPQFCFRCVDLDLQQVPTVSAMSSASVAIKISPTFA